MRNHTDRLKRLGIKNPGHLCLNLPTPILCEEAIRNAEGCLTHMGPLVVETGKYTGRSPNDKFIVREGNSQAYVDWGPINQPFSSERYERLRQRVLAYLQGRNLYVQNLYAGAHARHRISLQVISESAWHALFSRNMFILSEDNERFEPEYTLIHAPYFRALPEQDGTHSEVFIVLNLERKEVLIGGSQYAGEVKKSIFTLMNYLLPRDGVLSMHCSANYGADVDDVALFFGLSGTGKTTLSINASRQLIGDDEHGWCDTGVFNIEGGCYAKTIHLSPKSEPEIYKTTRMFGTIIENVPLDPLTRRMDLDDGSLTENTRAAFPITHLDIAGEQVAGHPRHIFFLSADAFGVLPPLSKLSWEQAIYYFLLGYTAKLAGTERGVKEPLATFSPCFGAPFMALPPLTYATMLGEQVKRHGTRVWLVNTGWAGGAYGVGQRIQLAHTRALVKAAMAGALNDAVFERDPAFGLHVPKSVPGVPSEVLWPASTWPDSGAYDQQVQTLAEAFQEHFKTFAGDVSTAVLSAGPPKR